MADLATAGREPGGGQGSRRRTPRSVLAGWEPSADRTKPVEILKDQDRTRVPELVPIRHGRMGASAFTFYRGAAGIMAADLAASPSTDLVVQLCGDAHLSNFGVFAAPDRRLIFDINDFDETHPGPFEWDVKRMAASFAIGGRDLGFKEKDRRAAVAESVSEYRKEMRRLASMRTIDVWYERLDLETLEQYRSEVKRRGRQKLRQGVREGGEQEQPAGVREAHALGRR